MAEVYNKFRTIKIKIKIKILQISFLPPASIVFRVTTESQRNSQRNDSTEENQEQKIGIRTFCYLIATELQSMS